MKTLDKTKLVSGNVYTDEAGDLYVYCGLSFKQSRNYWRFVAISPEGKGHFSFGMTIGFDENTAIKPVRRKPWTVFKGRMRSDGYRGYMAVSPNGKHTLLVAGCKEFPSIEACREYYGENNEMIAQEIKQRRSIKAKVTHLIERRGLNNQVLQRMNTFERQLKRLRKRLAS